MTSIHRIANLLAHRATSTKPAIHYNAIVIKRLGHDLSNPDTAPPINTDKNKGGPLRFTTSQAHLDYKATTNFYSEDYSLPKSHNLVLATTFISGLCYLFFLRDDIDNDGGANLLRPVHETIPELAIPLLEASIIENRKFGNNTKKLEMKLAEYRKHPEKYGGERRKLVEN